MKVCGRRVDGLESYWDRSKRDCAGWSWKDMKSTFSMCSRVMMLRLPNRWTKQF